MGICCETWDFVILTVMGYQIYTNQFPELLVPQVRENVKSNSVGEIRRETK